MELKHFLMDQWGLFIGYGHYFGNDDLVRQAARDID